MASVSDFTGAAGKAVQGDIIGGAVSLLEGFISGPSNWHKADDAWQAQQWPTVAQAYIKFYNDPSFNSNNQGGFNGDLQGFYSGDIAKEFKGYNVRRYERLGQLYIKTQDPQILNLYQKALAQGLISPNPAIGSSNPTPAFTNAIGADGGSVSGATSVNLGTGQQYTPAYNAGYNTPAATNNGVTGNNTNNNAKPPATTNNTTTYIIIAAVVAVVIILVVIIFKK